MFTWVVVEIDGLSVEEYQNHHYTWFFKRVTESKRIPSGMTKDNLRDFLLRATGSRLLLSSAAWLFRDVISPSARQILRRRSAPSSSKPK